MPRPLVIAPSILAAEAGIDRHHQDEIDEIDDVFD